jgi:hypothetical protein
MFNLYLIMQTICLPVISSNSSLCPGLYVGPGPHVLVLLLYPAQLGIAVLLCHLIIRGQVISDGLD